MASMSASSFARLPCPCQLPIFRLSLLLPSPLSRFCSYSPPLWAIPVVTRSHVFSSSMVPSRHFACDLRTRLPRVCPLFPVGRSSPGDSSVRPECSVQYVWSSPVPTAVVVFVPFSSVRPAVSVVLAGCPLSSAIRPGVYCHVRGPRRVAL